MLIFAWKIEGKYLWRILKQYSVIYCLLSLSKLRGLMENYMGERGRCRGTNTHARIPEQDRSERWGWAGRWHRGGVHGLWPCDVEAHGCCLWGPKPSASSWQSVLVVVSAVVVVMNMVVVVVMPEGLLVAADGPLTAGSAAGGHALAPFPHGAASTRPSTTAATSSPASPSTWAYTYCSLIITVNLICCS